MFQYKPGREADLAVANMWVKMERDGDLPGLFCASHRSLSGLIRIFQEPNGALLQGDDDGLWFAMWFEQLMGTVFVGVWISRERRYTRGGLDALLEGYACALSIYPALMGVTKQERLLRPHVRLGYKVMGCVPGLWDGEPAWIVMLTRPALAATLARYGKRFAAFDAAMARLGPEALATPEEVGVHGQ